MRSLHNSIQLHPSFPHSSFISQDATSHSHSLLPFFPSDPHDQTPNFATLYNILPLLLCLPICHYAGARIGLAVYPLAEQPGVRTPVVVRDFLFSTPVLPCPVTHPASSTGYVRDVYRGVKRPWHGVEPPPPPRAKVNNNER